MVFWAEAPDGRRCCMKGHKRPELAYRHCLTKLGGRKPERSAKPEGRERPSRWPRTLDDKGVDLSIPGANNCLVELPQGL